ncbi:MAG: hypothetical protein WBE22_00900 [Halobacteriota archaeon]
MLHPEPLNGVLSREEVVFDEEKRLSEGAPARGSGYSVAIAVIRRLRACGDGTATRRQLLHISLPAWMWKEGEEGER